MTDIGCSILGIMALFTYIVLLHLLHYSLAKECTAINKEPEYISTMKKLAKDIMCGYSSEVPPPGNTTIEIFMNVENYNFETEKQVIIVQSTLNTNWTDTRLKWNPDKYDGIEETDGGEYWLPRVELINAEDFYTYDIASLYHCRIYNTGLVSCRHRMIHETWCAITLANWPYDVQECTLEFGHEYKENYTLKLRISVAEEYFAGWHISEIRQEDVAGKKPGVTVTYVLVREAAGLSTFVMYPALVLTVLNILSLFLDVRRNVRLAVSCFSLFGHYYFLSQINLNMPKESSFTPIVLMYYRDSIILTIIIILLTFALRKLCSVNSEPHNSIKFVNNFVCDNKYSSYLVFPKWESSDVTVDFKSSNDDYVIFANVVNSVFIIFIAFAYFGLYISKIPKPII